MKKITCVALNSLLSAAALSQATFEMYNYDPSHGVDAPIFDSQGVPLVGPRYLAELWGGVAADSLAPALDYDYGRGRLIVPFYTGGYFYDFRSAWVFTVPSGGRAWLQVRVWDANLGSTYEEAVSRGWGGYGASPAFYAQGGWTGQNPGLPGPLIGLQSFSLLPVIPEPNAAMLLWLGLPLLIWCFRRPQ